jgi:ADP-heptose:LPS heptosyltransferase
VIKLSHMPKQYNIGIIAIFSSVATLRLKCMKLLDLLGGSLIAFCLFRKKDQAVPLNFKRILVIRPGGIGDAVFLLPLLRSLREKYPNLKVDILCEMRNRQIFLSQKELCDEIFCYDRIGEFISVFKRRYDIVIDTEQWHYLSAIAAYFCPGSISIGFATRPLRAKLFNKPCPYEIDRYELINFRNLFRFLMDGLDQIHNIDKSFHLSDQLTSWASREIPEQSITLFLGGSIALRRLTGEQSAAVIADLLKRHFDVVLLGGNDILDDVKMLTKEINDPRVRNYVGKVSLEESAALIHRSRLFIGTDSGLMHLACAVDTPVVAIFGPGNLKKWGPQGPRHAVISEYVSCSPCTHFGYTIPTCRGTFHCMRGLNAGKMMNQINQSLKAAPSK